MSSELEAILTRDRDGDGDDTIVAVFAQPRASKTRIVGLHGGMLKIALAAPPVDGAANKALLRYLAKALGVPRGDLSLVSGESGRNKRVLVRGRSPGEVAQALESHLG